MSEKHKATADKATAIGEKLAQRLRDKGTDVVQIELDAALDRALQKHANPEFAINQMKMVCRNKEDIFNAAMKRLLLQRSDAWQQKAGLTGHSPSANEGHSDIARNPAPECDDDGQIQSASNGHSPSASSSQLNDGDGGHLMGASDGQPRHAASPSPQGDGMGQRDCARNGQSSYDHPSPTVRGVGAT
jgi:hypothetical protein